MRTNVTRLSGAAFAAGVEVERLRSWLKQYAVLGAAPDGRGWRVFSRPDVAELAITRELVSWGVSPGLAWETAHQIVQRSTWKATGASMAPDDLAEAQSGRFDRGLLADSATFDKVAVVRSREPSSGLYLLEPVHDGGDLIEAAWKLDASAVLVIDCERIVRHALARLDSGFDTGGPDDD